VTLTDQNANTVTASQTITSAAGERTNFTVDASSLVDGPVAVEAVAEDDVGNTGATVQGSNATKDTVAPTISDYNVTGSDGDEFTVTFNATEVTTPVDSLTVDISASGPGQIEAKVSSNNVTSGDTKQFEITYRVSQIGEYDVTLDSVVDLAGNDGASGQTETVAVGSSADRTSYVSGSGSAARSGPESRVDFDIENTGSADVVVTDIEVSASSGGLRAIRENNGGSNSGGQHEVYIASSTPGILEADGTPYYDDSGSNAYQLGTRGTLTEAATLTGGERATVTLAYFRNNGGQTTSAADKQLTVTLYFQDGSSTTFTFTPPGY